MESRQQRSSSSNEKKKDEYQSQFDDLLGQASKKLTKEEQSFVDRQAEAKRIQDEEAAKIRMQEKEQYDKQKEQDFEDLVSGKTQAQSEKNLQTIFKEFYEKAKTDASNIDVKAYANSAKMSVGSLSTKLEERRNRFKAMKDKAMDLDHDGKETKQKVDPTKD